MPALSMSALGGKADTLHPRSNVCYDPKRTLFLRGHNVKVGGHLTAHSSANSIQLCAGSNAGVITRDHAIKYDYFGTPTNRAPVTLPSAPMSGA